MARGKEFFHGTTTNVKGTHILPLAERVEQEGTQPREKAYNLSHYPDLYKKQPWRSEHVFSTGSESEAWSWSGGLGRPRVHAVQPEGRPSPEAQTSDEVSNEKISRRARVLRTEWTPPREHASQAKSPNWQAVEGGVQGTLPPVDWGRYQTIGWHGAAKQEELPRRPGAASQNLSPRQFEQGKLF